MPPDSSYIRLEARDGALYARTATLYLDDVFSAVDVQTGQILWEAVRKAKAAGVTIVLVTHQLQLLAKPEVSRVCFVHEGGVRLLGTWAHVQASLGAHPQLKALLEHATPHHEVPVAAAADSPGAPNPAGAPGLASAAGVGKRGGASITAMACKLGRRGRLDARAARLAGHGIRQRKLRSARGREVWGNLHRPPRPIPDPISARNAVHIRMLRISRSPNEKQRNNGHGGCLPRCV